MDSFEKVIADILERKGYWTRICVKVGLTKEDKIAIGRPSSPRWELDVVGYRGHDNELLVLECKSYLDSPGVDVATFAGKNKEDEKRYKLFFEQKLRNVVLNRLSKQLVDEGFCAPRPKIKFGLAAGKIRGADEKGISSYFKKRKWELLTPRDIQRELNTLRNAKYENNVATVVVKLLLRGAVDD